MFGASNIIKRRNIPTRLFVNGPIAHILWSFLVSSFEKQKYW